jgi:hypothetical protein
MTREPLTRADDEPARMAAYRRLAVAILGLDVPTLARELSSARVQIDDLDKAA